MKHAIAMLENELVGLSTIEPLTVEDAKHQDAAAREFREAIAVLQRHEDRIGYNAGLLYDAYCKAVGGVAFNGDPLPDWDTFRADPAKQKQVDAWLAVGRTAAGDGGIVMNLTETPVAWMEPWAGPEQLHAPGDPSEWQPRTIRQWLETLPDGYRERALANMVEGQGDSERDDLGGALDSAFYWEGSPEGHEFWSTIRKGGELPPLPEPAPPTVSEWPVT